MEDRAFFTYAIGEKYLGLAFALARSYHFHNGHLTPFYIVSNEPTVLPPDLAKWVKVKIVDPEVVGNGLEFKLVLNIISPATHSIFIDSDSLIYDRVEYIFDLFGGNSVNVIGTKIIDGTWVDEQISELMAEFSLPYVIRYCGAFYYIKKCPETDAIFKTANLIYRKRTFQAHTHFINEEPLLSVAMSAAGVSPIQDDGNIWGDLVQMRPEQQLNVFKPDSVQFYNDIDFKFKFWLPPGKYCPKILHMGSAIYNKNPWIFDHYRLKLVERYHLTSSFSDLVIKKALRKLYFLTKRLVHLKNGR